MGLFDWLIALAGGGGVPGNTRGARVAYTRRRVRATGRTPRSQCKSATAADAANQIRRRLHNRPFDLCGGALFIARASPRITARPAPPAVEPIVMRRRRAIGKLNLFFAASRVSCFCAALSRAARLD